MSDTTTDPMERIRAGAMERIARLGLHSEPSDLEPDYEDGEVRYPVSIRYAGDPPLAEADLPGTPDCLPDERDGIPHNLIAHPLLILCPPLGRWLHNHTQPTVRPLWHRIADRVIPARSLTWDDQGVTTATICLVILAAIALCWFFGIHVHAAG